MAGSPGHQLADPDHQQRSPHNAQICPADAGRGIDAATAQSGQFRWPSDSGEPVSEGGVPLEYGTLGVALAITAVIMNRRR